MKNKNIQAEIIREFKKLEEECMTKTWIPEHLAEDIFPKIKENISNMRGSVYQIEKIEKSPLQDLENFHEKLFQIKVEIEKIKSDTNSCIGNLKILIANCRKDDCFEKQIMGIKNLERNLFRLLDYFRNVKIDG